MLAKDVKYTPSDSSWKKANGEDIANVKDAIDDLYNISNHSICSYTYSGSTLKKYTCDDNTYIKKFWYQPDASNGRFNINDLSLVVGDTVYFDFIVNLTQSVDLRIQFNDVDFTPTITNLGGNQRRYSGNVKITQTMVDSSRGFDYSNLRFIDLGKDETAPYIIESATIYYKK